MHCKSPFPEIKVSAHDENRHNIFNLLMHSLSSHSRHTVGDVEGASGDSQERSMGTSRAIPYTPPCESLCVSSLAYDCVRF